MTRPPMVFELDVASGTVAVQECISLTGRIQPGAAVSRVIIEEWLQAADPDDAQAIRDGIRRATERGTELDAVARFDENGAERWYAIRGRRSPVSPDGQAAGVIGTMTDITALKQAEGLATKSAQTLEIIVNASPDAIMLIGATGAIEKVNTAAGALFSAAPVDLLEQSFVDAGPIHPDDARLVQMALDRLMAGASSRDRVRYRIMPAGRERVVEAHLQAVRGEEGGSAAIVAVVTDVSDQAQLEEDIARAKSDAERANLAKSEFLSRMSHELRVPLNSVMGFAQLLKLDELTDEQQDSVQHILRAGEHLLELMNDVLDFSRIESGHLGMSMEPVGLDDVAREVVSMLNPTAADLQVSLILETPHPGYVVADRQRLRQVTMNIVSNSIKYNKPGGSVWIRTLELGNEQVKLQVTDNGVGIERENFDRVFAPFERMGAEQSGIEGTGVGLSLSKSLVEEMGGAIGFESEVGIGSTFWVLLPSAMSPAPRIPAEVQVVPSVSSLRQGIRIVYIEDSPANFALVERILSRHAALTLVPAASGKQGVELVRRQHTDLVLLDVHLPDMDGNEVLEALKTDSATLGVPVVVLSADASAAQKRRMMRAGAHAYLTKPVNVAELDHAIAEATGAVRAVPAMAG